MKQHLRFKELPAKNFGNCELCGERPARFYAVETLNKAAAADFTCRSCVSAGAVEFGISADLYVSEAA